MQNQNMSQMPDIQKDKPLAYAYVNWQKFNKIYDDLEVAYRNGTVFPELYMPFVGCRNK